MLSFTACRGRAAVVCLGFEGRRLDRAGDGVEGVRAGGEHCPCQKFRGIAESVSPQRVNLHESRAALPCRPVLDSAVIQLWLGRSYFGKPIKYSQCGQCSQCCQLPPRSHHTCFQLAVAASQLASSPHGGAGGLGLPGQVTIQKQSSSHPLCPVNFSLIIPLLPPLRRCFAVRNAAGPSFSIRMLRRAIAILEKCNQAAGLPGRLKSAFWPCFPSQAGLSWRWGLQSDFDFLSLFSFFLAFSRSSCRLHSSLASEGNSRCLLLPWISLESLHCLRQDMDAVGGGLD